MATLGFAEPGGGSRPAGRSGLAAQLAWALAPITVAAALGLLLRERLASADLAMLMLLAAVVVAAGSSRWVGVIGTLLAIVLFDLLFVRPYYRLSVSDAAYLVTFVVMLGVGLAIGHLTSRLRESALVRAQRERVATARLALSDRLADASDLGGFAFEAARFLANETGATTRVLLTTSGTTVDAALAAFNLPVADHGLRDGVLAVLEGDAAHHVTVDGWLVHRIHDGALVRGVATLEPREGVADPHDVIPLAEGVLDQLALLLERHETAQRHESARVEVEAERLRIALLSAVSHDLRTPLAAIEGAASTMLTGTAPLPDSTRTGLLESIQDEARRMNRLIGNLLDMVRVETGATAVHRSWQPIEEVIGVALLRMEPRLNGREIIVSLPADLPLVAIDELLVEHVFINLFENAQRHAAGSGPIEVTGSVHDDDLEITVRDHGPGLPPGLVVGAFHHVEHPSKGDRAPGTGLGLGLSICRGIVEAHGGCFTAGNHPDGGARITIRFPVGIAPSPPDDDREDAG